MTNKIPLFLEKLPVFRKVIEQNKEWYRAIAEDIPALVVRISPRLQITYANSAYCRFNGFKQDQIIGKTIFQFIPPENHQLVKSSFAALTPEKPIDSTEHANLSHDGRVRWVRWSNRAVFDTTGHLKEYLSIGEDFTERRTAEQTLRENEARNRALIDAVPDMLFRFSREGLCLDAKVKQVKHSSNPDRNLYSEQGLIGRKISEVLPGEIASLVQNAIHNAIATGQLQIVEYCHPLAEGEFHFEARLVSTGTDEVVSIVRDITDRKRGESQLHYLSLHDPLTGLYNRAYYENELQRLESGREYPVAILSADLDGLKLVNDILGHKEGDRIIKSCAQVLKKTLRKSDILARVGGDEFVLIMPRTDRAAGEMVMKRIRQGIENYNSAHSGLPLSISLGLAVSKNDALSLEETFKTADSLMYRDKHYRSEFVRGRIIKALLTILSERNYTTEDYTERLQELCWKLGSAAGLNMHQQTDLSLLALVHDLGMVAIPDQILNKREQLTEQEQEVFRQHPEKGFRIASSSPDLAPVADLILRHHECWDGSGYPLALKGEDIPIECRILSIITAYDAMVSPLPRGRFMSKDAALAELLRFAGARFDPLLVELFASVIGSNPPA